MDVLELGTAAQPAEGTVTETGTGKGIDGDVVVEVTADATTIYSVEVIEHNETEGIGTVAAEMLPPAIVEANSVMVDGISGATVTSDAIKAGVLDALSKAGIDTAPFEVAPEAGEAAEKSAETLDCDVVIVGAGGAGLTAAVRATQEGAKVIVLEKMPMVGGNSLKASGGMNAAGTKFQAEQDITDSGVKEFIEDTMNGGHQLNDIDLVTTMAENSAEAIDWLDSIGAPLPKVAATGATYEELAANMGLEGDAIDAFVETMNTWNASVAAGVDEEFGRDNGMDADLSTAPFYAIKIAPGIHHTMGGIKINTETEVISTEGEVIPGLYAAGETTGGVHGGNRIGGNAVCDFVVFGRIAGLNAAAYAAGSEEALAPAA